MNEIILCYDCVHYVTNIFTKKQYCEKDSKNGLHTNTKENGCKDYNKKLIIKDIL